MLKLISDEYRDLNKTFHDECETYGANYKWGEPLAGVILNLKVNSCLDYGCGKGVLRTLLSDNVKQFINYDPCMESFSKRPEGTFDLVVCLDVMEHVESQYTDNVLNDIFNYADKYVMFNIATSKSIKTLPDGRNTHINLRSNREWLNLLQKYFNFISVSTVSVPGYTAINYLGSSLKIMEG